MREGSLSTLSICYAHFCNFSPLSIFILRLGLCFAIIGLNALQNMLNVGKLQKLYNQNEIPNQNPAF